MSGLYGMATSRRIPALEIRMSRWVSVSRSLVLIAVMPAWEERSHGKLDV